MLGLIGTKRQFGVPKLAFSKVVFQIIDRDFDFICIPSVGDDGIGRWISQVLREAQLTMVADLYQAHDGRVIGDKRAQAT